MSLVEHQEFQMQMLLEISRQKWTNYLEQSNIWDRKIIVKNLWLKKLVQVLWYNLMQPLLYLARP